MDPGPTLEDEWLPPDGSELLGVWEDEEPRLVAGMELDEFEEGRMESDGDSDSVELSVDSGMEAESVEDKSFEVRRFVSVKLEDKSNPELSDDDGTSVSEVKTVSRLEEESSVGGKIRIYSLINEIAVGLPLLSATARLDPAKPRTRTMANWTMDLLNNIPTETYKARS